MRLIPLIVVVIALLLGPSEYGTSHAASKKKNERLAVIGLEAKYGIDKQFAEGLSVIIRDTIHSYGEYQVLSEDDIKAVASREHILQALGDDGAGQGLAQFGKSLGTRFMVAGSISKFGQTYTISLRMLDTGGSTPGVVKRVSEDCQCSDDGLIETVRVAAARLISQEYQPTAKTTEPRLQNPATSAAITSPAAPTLAGRWTGYWMNSLGEKAPDSLVLEEASDGGIRGLWDGKVPVSGRWTTHSALELYGETATRAYDINGVLEGNTLTFEYLARRLDAPGSYRGRSIFTRKE